MPAAAIDGSAHAIVRRGGWSLFMQSEVTKFQRDDAAGWDGPWYSTALPRDHFTYVVGTFDGTSMHLYIDGLDVKSNPSTRPLTASPDPVSVGANLPAVLDEVAVYDHALAPERVKAHYHAGSGK